MINVKKGFKDLILPLICAVSVTVSSQIIRFFAVEYLKPVQTGLTIDGFARLNYHENTGASFGIFSDFTAGLSIFTAILIIFLMALIFFNFFKTNPERILVGLIIGGGLSNLVERIFYGYVVDYVEFLFVNFAVFNFADCFVTVCGVLLIIVMFFSDKSIFAKEQKQ